jgi:hypothetical protein
MALICNPLRIALSAPARCWQSGPAATVAAITSSATPATVTAAHLVRFEIDITRNGTDSG